MNLPCVPTVNVLYEDPTTVVLTSSYIDTIWKAVSEVKKDGFKIDGMTSYTVTSGIGSSASNNVNLLVVLSR